MDAAASFGTDAVLFLCEAIAFCTDVKLMILQSSAWTFQPDGLQGLHQVDGSEGGIVLHLRYRTRQVHMDKTGVWDHSRSYEMRTYDQSLVSEHTSASTSRPHALVWSHSETLSLWHAQVASFHIILFCSNFHQFSSQGVSNQGCQMRWYCTAMPLLLDVCWVCACIDLIKEHDSRTASLKALVHIAEFNKPYQLLTNKRCCCNTHAFKYSAHSGLIQTEGC